MPSTFFGLNIAASGLTAFQASINTIANNVSNVQTPGYTRQTTTLESTEPIRVYSRYGSVGTGVAAVRITQERNLYYDTKYWQNNASRGLFEQKLYYLDQVQTIFKDDQNSAQGFSTIFATMFNAMDTLKTNGGDETVRKQFIHQAQSLCTYFNALNKDLEDMQEDCNEEIRSSVSNINSISEKIALLNRQINMIEVRGGFANELRDQRALLVDELSGLVSVETQEYEVKNTYGENLGGTNYRVVINGQMLVDGNDYRTLDCVSSEYKQNQMDVDGLYSVVWSDTQMDFASMAGAGSLNALFLVRDGNNNENMKGYVSEMDNDADTGKGYIKMENLSMKDVNAMTVPEKGQVKIGNIRYNYDSWEAEVDENGLTSITYHLSDALEGNNDGLIGKSISCGTSVDAMGIPYYQGQINEFLRNFTQAFNDIEKKGNTLDDEPMGSFFVGETKTGIVFDVDEYDDAVKQALEDKENNLPYQYTLTSSMDSYYQITASTVKVNDRSMQDASYFSTATEINKNIESEGNVDKYDIAEELMTLQKDVKMFRGDSAEKFLEKLLSDVTVDVNKVEIQAKNYGNLCTTIISQRTSVSGVDEDEEGANLIKYQNAYNLASKMISVMAELYDRLINQTGVT
ncbi:MAG: flagellar hook-associated protein FlgK [Roseburia sp.]|nr:flagellar hook-associated protein FlgK [Roseburia sp.]MCM1429873.1 flagellar hook-associated protein FlgK [Muribaculaceae bacterium]